MSSNHWQRLTGLFKGRTSWAVVSTVAEPAELLYAFAAHYLLLGADEVRLFIDDANQKGLEELKSLKGVHLTICDDNYWENAGRPRPLRQEARQIHNANLAYRECASDWLFFCDADEYLLPTMPIAKILSTVEPETIQCRPYMAERVFMKEQPQNDMFQGLLKRPIPQKPKVLESVFGEMASFTTGGLLGHVIGKSFTRVGLPDIRIKLHMAVPGDPAEEKRRRQAQDLPPGPRLQGVWLVHYDGLTPLHWKLKLLRYAKEYKSLLEAGVKNPFAFRLPSRLNQIRYVCENLDDPQVFDGLIPLIQPDATALTKLRQADAILDLKIDPTAAARKFNLPADSLTAAQFDANLRRNKAKDIESYNI